MNIPSAFKLSAIGFTGILALLTFSKRDLPKVQAHEVSEGCSVATLNGAYGLVLTGQVLQVGPIVSVGVSTFDGKGKFVTDQTLNVNGNAFPAQGSGNYTVNRNCTGVADLVGAGPHPFVIVDGGEDPEKSNLRVTHFSVQPKK